jgi:hypothetical protein
MRAPTQPDAGGEENHFDRLHSLSRARMRLDDRSAPSGPG